MIECNLFGLPIVRENGKEIILPVNKMSAVLYYVLINKVVSRDELSGMFWGDSSDQKAKTSLRNALHKLRRLFQEEIIISTSKSIVAVNTDVEIKIDVEEFEKSVNTNLYKGDFLKGFYLKNVIEFENWVSELREYYKEKCLEAYLVKIDSNIENGKFDSIEHDIKSVLQIDQFNDKAYLNLFNYYKKVGRIDKIINEYHDYQVMLEEELGVYPDEKITAIYKSAIHDMNSKSNVKKDCANTFFGRTYDKEKIQANIDNYVKGKDYKSVLICGETGIGKSVLKREVINQNSDLMIFEASCLKVEQQFSYSIWIRIIELMEKEFTKLDLERPPLWDDLLNNFFFLNNSSYLPNAKILENRENFTENMIYSAIINALKKLSEYKKVIMAVEDLQWADQLSVKLITNLLLKGDKNVFFILTKSDEYIHVEDSAIYTLKDINRLDVIELKRFTRQEVGAICKKLINKPIAENEIDDIYFKSKGNAFFLHEYIQLYNNGQENNPINSKMQSILREKFSLLNEKEHRVLEISSILYRSIKLDLLVKVLKYDAFEIIDCINSLIKLNILEEHVENGNVSLNFAYSAYKEFVYNNISEYSRQMMHNEVGQMLEKDLIIENNDIRNYLRLQYHFERANNKVKRLKYEIYILNYYLNFTHEIFPSLNDYDLNRQVKLYLDNNKVMEWIEKIEKEINDIKGIEKQSTEEILRCELLFLYCKGRYFIREGNYTSGVKIMNRVIEFSENMKDYKMAINGHKQMAIYSIQVMNQSLMLKHVLEGIDVAKAIDDNLELGIFYRLYGVYHLSDGNFSSAEELFLKSIDIFEYEGILEGTNSISIAANYNYIGEIRCAQGNFQEAKEYFSKSIALCEDGEVSCLALFYINLGKTLFLEGELFKMKEYFYKAEIIVKRFDSYWKKPVLEAYLSLINFLGEKYDESKKLLKNAMHEIKTINNPRDIGYVYFIQTIIAYIIKNDFLQIDDEMGGLFTDSYEIYYYKSMEYLDKHRDAAEITYLKENITFD